MREHSNKPIDYSDLWYCPFDKCFMELNHTRQNQSPYFRVSCENFDISITNAVSVKKILPESFFQAKTLAETVFREEPELREVELVGVRCPVCKKVFAALKRNDTENTPYVKGDSAKVFFQMERERQATHFGPFRFVDYFGITRSKEQQNSSNTFFLWWWVITIRTLLLMVILVYILGLEMRVGKKWIKVGMIGTLSFVILLAYLSFFTNILDPLKGALSRVVGF